jgi:hypothetical protein
MPQDYITVRSGLYAGIILPQDYITVRSGSDTGWANAQDGLRLAKNTEYTRT